MSKLLNYERASELMARDGLDALVAQQPVNSYYLSSYWGHFNSAVGYDGSYFAMLPRDSSAPAALIAPAMEIGRLAASEAASAGTWMPGVYTYSKATPGAGPLPDGTPRGADFAGWPVAAGAQLTQSEEDWLERAAVLGQQMSPDAFHALARALRAAELQQARVGVDDARVAGWLEQAGLQSIEVVYCPHLFNEIRLQKTEAEVEIMRQAAHINEMSVLLAADSMQVGSTRQELENLYMLSMAQQGGRGVYLAPGVTELTGAGVREREPVCFAALGQFQHYHGSSARCAVVGEPSADYRKRHAKLLLGWEEAREKLRPGASYSEVAQAAGDAVRKSGLGAFPDPTVHSIGLEHTDDARVWGAQPQTPRDCVLQPGMIVSVDMSLTEIGWGSIHMGDTVRITTYGHERLSKTDLSIRIAGAEY